jgi:hypothetical protein
MPYLIEAHGIKGYTCRTRTRVKRDAFEMARFAACVLGFNDLERAQLGETKLGPGVPSVQVVTAQGWVKVTRVN